MREFRELKTGDLFTFNDDGKRRICMKVYGSRATVVWGGSIGDIWTEVRADREVTPYDRKVILNPSPRGRDGRLAEPPVAFERDEELFGEFDKEAGF